MVDSPDALSSRRSGAVVFALLLTVYVVTLAPGVTYWDAGEFLAAMKTLGIPHPPGTPLFILAGNVWGRVLAPLFGFAYSVNLLSAVCTAAACGIFAAMMTRWTGRATAAIAGGVLAGLMSSVWLNANETEVYAPALLMSALFLFAADKLNESGDRKWLVLLAYLFGLGWALQLSALVAAPAAILLALHARRSARIPVLPMIIAGLLGASVVLFMIVRAQHDPGINQGNPSNWQAFADVITRKQYQPVSMLPRQAPWYIQIGNFFEYADWQVALGLHPEAPPSIARTSLTVLYVMLGITGFVWHKRTDIMSWRVLTLLFICGSLGVIAYLNMKASPSYGTGFLPANAKHEARERDYFFALAFVCWGLWAGAGAVRVFARVGPKWSPVGIVVAFLPALLNYPATNRRSVAGEIAPRDSALRILNPAPPNAVVFAYGDNDTYPVWYMQQVEGVRRDVTTVTIPLLGAAWYRGELQRRDALLDDDRVRYWRGDAETMKGICVSAKRQNRPVIAKTVRDRPSIPSECN
ncbi:MAG TPA: DUF2723 domain-containing protein [Gemmatimonadaceae bacterium]|nr:DUF2723 domain-containing protein [Gemmatimonadaceae bacterium]